MLLFLYSWMMLAFAGFPLVEGKAVSGDIVRLPEAIGAGERAVILIAQTRAQQKSLDTWAEPLRDRGLPFWEVPIIGKVSGVLEGTIRMGMRWSYANWRERYVVPIFEDGTPIVSTLGIDDATIHVFVVDGGGEVVRQWRGDATPDALLEVHQTVFPKN